jgi:hypothetical protein
MNPVPTSAFIGAAVTISLFLLSHLGIAIWFASRMSAKVAAMSDAVQAMAVDLKSLAAIDTRLAVLEQRMTRNETDSREALRAATLAALNRKDFGE